MLLVSNVRPREQKSVNDVTQWRGRRGNVGTYREVSDMPPQGTPLFGHGSLIESTENPHGPSIPEPPPMSGVVHRAQPAPADHLCACGKIREACVNDEVRALFALMSDPSPTEPPK